MFILIWLWTSLFAWSAPVYITELDGSVNPGSAEHLISAIEQANAAEAEAIILRIDTPGGLVSSAREIVQAELGSDVPVIAWVGPAGARAASAGVFLTMAADVAVMAPGTTIGAAHPVDLLGGSPDPDAEDPNNPMEAKVLNDMVAWAKSIAEQRGRNIEWAELAVTDSVMITDSEAVKIGVVDAQATDIETLLAVLDGRQLSSGGRTLHTLGAEIIEVEMTSRQKVVDFLGNPDVLVLLIGAGLLGLYIEFYNPGLIVPSVLGASCLLAAGVGLSLIPFNSIGVVLLCASVACFVAEVFVTSYGLLSLLGTICMTLGALVLFEVSGFDLRVSKVLIFSVAITLAGSTALLSKVMLSALRRPVAGLVEQRTSATGTVISGGENQGWVIVDGERWRATWSGSLAAGDTVRIDSAEGLTLRVSSLNDA